MKVSCKPDSTWFCFNSTESHLFSDQIITPIFAVFGVYSQSWWFKEALQFNRKGISVCREHGWPSVLSELLIEPYKQKPPQLKWPCSNLSPPSFYLFIFFLQFWVWWHLDRVGNQWRNNCAENILICFFLQEGITQWHGVYHESPRDGGAADCNELSRSRCRVVSGALMGATDASLQLKSQQERWGALCRSAYTKEHCRVMQST